MAEDGGKKKKEKKDKEKEKEKEKEKKSGEGSKEEKHKHKEKKHRDKDKESKEKKHKHKEKKSTTSMFLDCVERILSELNEETTSESLSDLIKNAHSTTSFSTSERASIGVYVLIRYAKEWKAVPSILEKYGSVIRSVGCWKSYS